VSERSDGLPLDEAALDEMAVQARSLIGSRFGPSWWGPLIAQARTALTLSAQVKEWEARAQDAGRCVLAAEDKVTAIAAECARLREALRSCEQIVDDDGSECAVLVRDVCRVALAAPSASEAVLAERDAAVGMAVAVLAIDWTFNSPGMKPGTTTLKAIVAKALAAIRQRAESGEAS